MGGLSLAKALKVFLRACSIAVSASVIRESCTATRLCIVSASARCLSTKSRACRSSVVTVSIRASNSGGVLLSFAAAKVWSQVFANSSTRSRECSSSFTRPVRASVSLRNSCRVRCRSPRAQGVLLSKELAQRSCGSPQPIVDLSGERRELLDNCCRAVIRRQVAGQIAGKSQDRLGFRIDFGKWDRRSGYDLNRCRKEALPPVARTLDQP